MGAMAPYRCIWPARAWGEFSAPLRQMSNTNTANKANIPALMASAAPLIRRLNSRLETIHRTFFPFPRFRAAVLRPMTRPSGPTSTGISTAAFKAAFVFLHLLL